MVGATTSNVLRRITTLLIICCLVTVGLCVNTAAGLPGSGTEEDPWRIESLADFDEFAADPNYWDDCTRLETDVNLAGRTYSTAVIAPDVNNSNPYFDGTAFTGVFDGNDHKIMNLSVDDERAGNDYLGLFGGIGEDSKVMNLGLEAGSLSGDGVVGGLVGRNWVGSVSNCYSTGNVNGDGSVGGLVGLNTGSVSNCYSTVDVNGDGHSVGGLVAVNCGSISNCYYNGSVSGDSSVGGLVGYNSFVAIFPYPDIFNSYSTGRVHGTSRVGGLVGDNWAAISNCYSTGAVNGVEVVGGLVGLNVGGVSNCYSTGDVNGIGDNVGGLVGEKIGIVSQCFWDVETSAKDYSSGGTGKTTAEMKTKSTFTNAGWDFVEIWLINEGATSPVLRQEIRSDLNGDAVVDLKDLALFASHWLEGKVD